MTLKDIVYIFNVNGITYQIIKQEEFDSTYVKANILSLNLNNTFLSFFNSLFELNERTGYYEVGDNLYVTFNNLEVDFEEEREITFAQLLLFSHLDEVAKAECIGGNVNMVMDRLPKNIGNILAKCQKCVSEKYVTYTVKRNNTTLNLTVKR